MSENTFSQRARTVVDRTKALFTLDPRWHEEPVYEGDPDPRVGELLARLESADPIARTEDDQMAVRIDPDTLRGWLVTQADASDETDDTGQADDTGPTDDTGQADDAGETDDTGQADDTGQTDDNRQADDTGQADDTRQADDTGQTDDAGQADASGPVATRKLTPLHSAQVRALRYHPELLERYQQTGTWDDPPS